ncbi:MAG: peptidylprolyl isomerase [Gammaproteobacteria bacterium]|nr:peptidylprolyl isomerase [Gammaproteobacteria bacterium]
MNHSQLISLSASLAAAVTLGTAAYAADTAPVTAPASAQTAPLVTDAAFVAIDAQIAAAQVDKTATDWKTSLSLPKIVTFDASKKYLAHMVTNKGELVIEFKPKIAPQHVTNFMYLARLGFYDGLPFHRVIQGFMAQGGDPLGNGSGGPGYKFAGEFEANTKHDRAGVVSTANAGPNTDGSQFFIMFNAYPSLDMNYSIFGQVIEGLDVLEKIEAAGNPGDGPPSEPLNIVNVTIEVK